jgi:hypothetical protein
MYAAFQIQIIVPLKDGYSIEDVTPDNYPDLLDREHPERIQSLPMGPVEVPESLEDVFTVISKLEQTLDLEEQFHGPDAEPPQMRI